MKAVIINSYGDTGVLKFTEVPKPVPGRKEVLVKTAYAAVNPADWKVRQGKLRLITGRKFPKILGIEASGIVEATGEGVKSFKPGQHVFAARNYTTGCYAEYFSVPEKNVLLLPENMPLEKAASIAVTGVTAYQCLVHHGNLEEGMHVLVNGASGGVGIMAVQIAGILGARVTGVCSAQNSELVKSFGADEVIDYTTTDPTRSDKKYDIIIDAASNLNLKNVEKILEKGGILIKLNINYPTIRDQIKTLFSGKRKVKLVLLKMIPEDFLWVRDQIALGKLDVRIDRIFSLEECSKAHEYSESLRARGKILLKI